VTWVVVAVIAVVVVAVVAIAWSRRRRIDGVESFQRHIDALSPEARRRVVDRVQRQGADGDPDGADQPAGDEPDGGVDGA